MADDQILCLEKLKVETITGRVLVDDVDVTLKRGEILGLIGESGAGKSTIGLASMAYARAGMRITGGTITLAGTELRASTAQYRRHTRGKSIAYIAQSAAASFNPSMTLMDQVCEAPVVHGVMSRAEAEVYARKLFRILQLPNPDTIGERYPHQVSGGQLQRVMAAMAMSCRPDVIVLDEPTTALDVTTQIEVLALLRDLIREFGTAGLYITHDLAVVAQIAHRIMVLRHGKMVEVGDAQQILENPKTDYCRALVNERREAEHLSLSVPDKAAQPILRVKNVTAGYGPTPIVKNASFDLAKGETLAVVGESGSGKSTVARIIVGLLPRWSGEIELSGQGPVAGSGPAAGRHPAPPADGAPDARRGPEPAADPGPDHRAPGRLLLQALAQRRPHPRPRTAAARRAARGIRRPAARPTLGRAEAARLHRARARGRARRHHLRRADLRPRPARGRRGPEADEGPAGRPRARLYLHHA